MGREFYLDAVRESGDEDHRILLVGEDNPLSNRPEYALFPSPPGCAGHRLQSQILRIPPLAYLSLWRTNLCSPSWHVESARERLVQLVRDADAPWSVIALLGRKIHRTMVSVFGLDREFDYFEIISGPRTIVLLPHPSGRCREWNDPASAEAARAAMRVAAPSVAWGSL